MSGDLSLSDIWNGTSNAISSPEQALKDMLTSLNSSSSANQMSVEQMVELQYQMSVYSIGASTISGVVKELADTMKGVIQKF